MFYARSSKLLLLSCANTQSNLGPEEHWAGQVISSSEQRGKELRRVAFGLAKEKYGELQIIISILVQLFNSLLAAQYEPILKEVERILAEAGLDEEEMRRGAAGGAGGKPDGISRNRR